jgi:gluconate 5-dehydrogenase
MQAAGGWRDGVNATYFSLAGRRALVTGSSRGIGLALARGLGEAGASLVLNARDEERLTAAGAGLRATGLVVETRAFDVTDPAAVEAAVGRIESEIGPIDILVNNAGIQRRAPAAEMTAAQWRDVVETNLNSVFYVSQAVGRRMIARRRGKIVTICSLMTEVARPTVANYAAAKGGLKMLIRSLAVEWAKFNVQVNGIGPGYFKTEMTRPLYEDPKFSDWVCARTPAGRWGQPEELIGAAVFLSSSASDFVNGQIVYVDGGILAGV